MHSGLRESLDCRRFESLSAVKAADSKMVTFRPDALAAMFFQPKAKRTADLPV
jgi:hypothetical protein